MEFKTGALEWSPDLTKENHNNFINSANEIVQIVSKDLISNKTSTFCTKKRFIFSCLRSYGVSLFNEKWNITNLCNVSVVPCIVNICQEKLTTVCGHYVSSSIVHILASMLWKSGFKSRFAETSYVITAPRSLYLIIYTQSLWCLFTNSRIIFIFNNS